MKKNKLIFGLISLSLLVSCSDISPSSNKESTLSSLTSESYSSSSSSSSSTTSSNYFDLSSYRKGYRAKGIIKTDTDGELTYQAYEISLNDSNAYFKIYEETSDLESVNQKELAEEYFYFNLDSESPRLLYQKVRTSDNQVKNASVSGYSAPKLWYSSHLMNFFKLIEDDEAVFDENGVLEFVPSSEKALVNVSYQLTHNTVKIDSLKLEQNNNNLLSYEASVKQYKYNNQTIKIDTYGDIVEAGDLTIEFLPLTEGVDTYFDDAISSLKNQNYECQFEENVYSFSSNKNVVNIYDGKVVNDKFLYDVYLDGSKQCRLGYIYDDDNKIQQIYQGNSGTYYYNSSPYSYTLEDYLPTFLLSSVFFQLDEINSSDTKKVYTLKEKNFCESFDSSIFTCFNQSSVDNLIVSIEENQITFYSTYNYYGESCSHKAIYKNINKVQDETLTISKDCNSASIDELMPDIYREKANALGLTSDVLKYARVAGEIYPDFIYDFDQCSKYNALLIRYPYKSNDITDELANNLLVNLADGGFKDYTSSESKIWTYGSRYYLDISSLNVRLVYEAIKATISGYNQLWIAIFIESI